MDWLRRKLVPSVATTLTVDKLSREEVEEMLAAEQRATTRRALQEKFGDRNLNLSLERLEFLRRRALDEENAGEPSPAARSTALSREEEAVFVEELRREYGINQGASFARMERITRTGFTLQRAGSDRGNRAQNHGLDAKLRPSRAPLRPRQPLGEQSL